MRCIPVMPVCSMHTLSSPYVVLLAMFALCHQFGFLCILFACLPTCSCMTLCLSVLSIFQSNGAMDIRPYPLYFSCSLLKPRSLGMAMSVLYFLYLTGTYPWNIGNVWFTFPLYVVALCMMYVYLYLFVYGWLCTLYDGLWWLREWPSLVMRALELVVWVCAQGNCHRCKFMLYRVCKVVISNYIVLALIPCQI